MKGDCDSRDKDERARQAVELTSVLLHRHYCENDIDGVTCHFDDPFSWIGTGETEYGIGHDHVKAIFERFAG